MELLSLYLLLGYSVIRQSSSSVFSNSACDVGTAEPPFVDSLLLFHTFYLQINFYKLLFKIRIDVQEGRG